MKRLASSGLIVAAGIVIAFPAQGQWPQFGGPQRNFHAPAGRLAKSWPEAGPPVTWRRELGDGYSGVLVDDDRLYSMYRRGGDEVIIAMARDSGLTIWEHSYPVVGTFSALEFGGGPASTPSIVGDRLVTVGVGIDVHCINKESGEILWSRDMMEEFELSMPGRGFASSPLVHDGLVILPIGGHTPIKAIDDANYKGIQNGSVVAFDLDTGKISWVSQDFPGSKASPILIEFEGRPQVVVFMGNELAGLEPQSGELLWRIEHSTDYGFNCSTPVYDGEDTIICSSAYSNCTEAVQLVATEEGIEARRKWTSRRLRIHFTNMVLVEGRLYGISGMGRPGFLTCLDVWTGEMFWRSRGFARGNLVYAGGPFVILDEDGQLALVTFTDDGPEIRGRLFVADSHAFTTPTLVGTDLYVRDRSYLTAFDLSPSGVQALADGRGRAFQQERPELPPEASSFLGEYETGSSGMEPKHLRVLLEDGWLMIELPGQSKVRLAHQAKSKRWEFIEDRTSGSAPRTVEFQQGEQGTIEFVLRSPRQAQRTYRITRDGEAVLSHR